MLRELILSVIHIDQLLEIRDIKFNLVAALHSIKGNKNIFHILTKMGLLLKGSLALLFVGIGALIFMFPSQTKKYVNFRYEGLRHFLYSTFHVSIPDKIIREVPDVGFRVVACIMFIGSLAILFHKKWAIMLYAYFILIVGGILHVPYDSNSVVSQLRKLIFVVAIFFGLIVLSVQKTKEEIARGQKRKEEVKEEAKKQEKAKAE